MTHRDSPVVFAGPSIDADQVRKLLPDAKVLPSIQRGDLYRERMLRHSLFVIIDGVFMHGEAISPREIVDVLKDGGIVVGASSMGALRAADCAPAGMRGIGTIFRLFYRGILDSDDEVAVAFDPKANVSTVPLVNVRYAAWRATRSNLWTAEQAAAVVAEARRLFYSERRWRAILPRCGIAVDESMLNRLATWDLKRLDAERALRRVRAWLYRDRGIAHRPRQGQGSFRRNEETRERSHRHFPAGEPSSLLRWLSVSGRYRRYLPQLAPHEPRRATSDELETFWAEREVWRDDERAAYLSERGFEWERLELLVGDPRARARALSELLESNSSEPEARLWHALELEHAVEAELQRHLAIRAAAVAFSGRVPAVKMQEAVWTISAWHGIEWTCLLASFSESQREELVALAEQLARAKAWREHLFASLAPHAPNGPPDAA